MSEYKTPNFSIDLSGQIALVTGASSGLGYRFAKVLASCGAKVAISARRKEKLESLAEEIKSAGGECMVVPIDMTDRKSIKSAVDTVSKEMGAIDTLVNNAGIPDAQWAVKQSEELIDNVMETNLTGPYILSCEVARKLIEEKKPGRMVNIASVAGKEGNPNAGPYSAAKAGVIALTKSLGKELADYDIAVNCVTPAAAKTQIFEQISEEHIQYMLSKIPRNRFLKVEEAASMVSWLCSEENSFTTGGVFDLSGGRSTY